MHVVAIIQARMESTRLPGKVLLPLAGKPVLWHVIHRLRQCRRVNQICLAIPHGKANDALEQFGKEEGVLVFRGSEDNVLERYYLAARATGADIVIRVTGDAPLIEPRWLDYMVSVLIDEGVDITEGDLGIDSIHEGFTPVTFRALEKIMTEAGDDPLAREHVTTYLEQNPGLVSAAPAIPWPEHRFRGARLSVDTPADLAFLEELYRRLKAPPGEADLAEVVALLKKEPELLKINAHVHQKGAQEKTHRILFRCDGDEEIGFGHLTRCLALAGELRDSYGCGITFAMACGKTGQEMVQKYGYHLLADETLSESGRLAEIVECVKPSAVVFDYRGPLDFALIDKWRREKIVTASIDDPTAKRLHVDLNFYPPVPQVSEMDWIGFKGERYCGWQWVVLRREFAGLKENRKEEQVGKPLLLVTMGGSDPLNLTLKALKAIDGSSGYFAVAVLLGPGFKHRQALDKFLAQAEHSYQVHNKPADVSALFVRADLAVASFGVTAYELAAAGVPSILLGISEDHVFSASSFESAGIAVNLGLHSEVGGEAIREALLSLLADNRLREKMSTKAGRLVDGRGAERIVRLIYNRLNN